jgi:valyl-tRNA synthetase
MADKGKYYITTAIAYTSGKPHIGNTYEIILADAIARWKRQEGYDVFFQTGTDEHGQKIEDRARTAGRTPKETRSHSESSSLPMSEYASRARAAKPSKKSKTAAASISTNAMSQRPRKAKTTPMIPHTRFIEVIVSGMIFRIII